MFVTYHDLGLNYVSNFQAFFNYPDLKEITAGFAVFHINAPGQEDGATNLSEDFEYPSMEQLGEQVKSHCVGVVHEVSFIGARSS